MMVTAQKGLGATGSTIIGATGGAVGTSIGAFTPLIFGAAAGPIGLAVGAVVAAGAAIASALGLGAGCGQPCIQATTVVNNAEPTFVQNLEAYETGQISQTEAISNYQQLQTAVTQACNGIQGAAGQNCVSDRFTAGGCKWKATSQPYPASPPVGACWNWVSGYYDPLLQPAVTPYVATSTNPVSSALSTGEVSTPVGTFSLTDVIVVGAMVVGLMMVGD